MKRVILTLGRVMYLAKVLFRRRHVYVSASLSLPLTNTGTPQPTPLPSHAGMSTQGNVIYATCVIQR